MAATAFDVASAVYNIDDRPILSDISFTTGNGKVTGLIGPNGSGKSTLVKLLARQLHPTSGAIRFAGKDVADFQARELARSIAYMPQFTPPAEGMTGRELVALGRYPWHGSLGRFTTHDAEQVNEAIDATGTRCFADRLVDSLSGGERQRVWLAMMLAQNARAIILDEPISALDLRHAVLVLQLVQRISRQGGISIVVVLHDVNLAARFCDEILALSAGKLIAHGRPEAILKPAILERIYDVPMKTVSVKPDALPIAYVA